MKQSKNARQALGVAALLGVSCSLAHAGVTWLNPTRVISAGTSLEPQANVLTSTTLAPLVTSVQQTGQVNVGGNPVDIGSIASISCVFDPEGVNNRTRLDAVAAGGAGAGASVLISVGVLLDSATPYRIRQRNHNQTGTNAATLQMSLRDELGNAIFETTSPDAFQSVGVLQPGTYAFHYVADLDADEGASYRELIIRFDARCFADLDDGTEQGNADSSVDIHDLIYFLKQFEMGDENADIDDGSGTGLTDGAVTADDLVFFLARFEQGC